MPVEEGYGGYIPPQPPPPPPTPTPTFDPAAAGRDIASMGASEEERYQAMLRQGALSPEQMRMAQVEKDRLLHQWNQMRGAMNSGQPVWQANMNQWGIPTSGTVSPDWIPDQPWLNPQFQQSPYSTNQPQMQFQNTDWASIDPRYRTGVQSWMQGQGMRGGGSLGQYGWNTWNAPQGFNWNQNMINTVPDENLRMWLTRLATGKGWMR